MLAIVLIFLAVLVPAPASTGPAFAPDCPISPANNVWHADISRLPIHPRSSDWISSMGGRDERLHPDFGPSFGEIPVPYGIPFDVVDGDHPKVQVAFDGPDGGYPEESDPGPYPFDENTKIEGGANSTGDRHALMIDRDNCMLYELYHADWNAGNPTADQGSIFDLRSNDLRPDGWTSADAAGLPIFAGLIRRNEVEAGEIDHAIRVTADQTGKSYLWPARHQAGARSDPTLPPMGARFRLKAGFDISGFRPDTRVILRAMKEHGLIVADNGSNWFFGGTSEEGWNNAMLDELKTILAGQFEAVDASSLMVDPDSGRASAESPCTSTGSGTIVGTAGSDVLCGSGGGDTIRGLGGGDVLVGRGGDDTLNGGAGTDTVSYTGSSTGVRASLTANSATGQGRDTFVGVEDLSGSAYVDTLVGSGSANRLSGGGGKDALYGRSSGDLLVGGPGSDELFGEGNADTLYSRDGVNGNDSLDGGSASDTCLQDARERSIRNCP